MSLSLTYKSGWIEASFNEDVDYEWRLWAFQITVSLSEYDISIDVNRLSYSIIIVDVNNLVEEIFAL